MPDYTTQDIRNVALVGHGGTGKTMLAEAMLHKAGAIAAPGEKTPGAQGHGAECGIVLRALLCSRQRDG